MGKKNLEESDSEEEDDVEDGENERSIVLDNGNDSDSNKETDGSLDSVSGGKMNGECSGVGSCESGSEEEKETTGQVKPEIMAEKVVQATNISCLYAVESEAVKPVKEDSDEPESGNVDATQLSQMNSGLENDNGIANAAIDSVANDVSESKPRDHEKGEEPIANTDMVDATKPLNFDDFSSAAEMEV